MSIPRSLLTATASVACALAMVGCGGDSTETDTTDGTSGETTYISIGTGGETGVYFQVGAALSAMINEQLADAGLRADFQSTKGSVANIRGVLNDTYQIGVAQSDRQFQATNGQAEWDGQPQAELRAICGLYPESITLVASVESGITSVADLAGKRVNIGNQGSGHRGNAIDVLTAFGIDPETGIQAESIKAAEAPRMLQDGRIDAFFYTVGHPNAAIEESTAGSRQIRLVPIEGQPVTELLNGRPYYSTSAVPTAFYPNAANTEDTPTMGVSATLVCSANLPEAVVYQITKMLFENLDAFKTKHNAFGVLTPAMMLQGLSAPLHPGAEKYFKEAGLL